MALHKDEAMEACLRFVRRFDAHSSSGIMVVFRELLTNAIEHGTALLHPKVSVEIRVTASNHFKVTVTDSGRGFDYGKLDTDSVASDPRQVKNRGYRLIRSFADKLHFNDQGNSVTAYVPLANQKTTTEGEGLSMLDPLS
jgi:anti-sigma regulatory factor (Ser/Thr protein kinase)